MMAAKMFFNACSQDEAHSYQKASLWCWWQDQWMTLEHPFSALAIATLADVSVNVQQQTHEKMPFNYTINSLKSNCTRTCCQHKQTTQNYI
jgi:hypothetical protein